MTTIPKPRDITEILRGVGSAEFPWKDPTLGTLLHRAADEIERLRAVIVELDDAGTAVLNLGMEAWPRFRAANASLRREARRG